MRSPGCASIHDLESLSQATANGNFPQAGLRRAFTEFQPDCAREASII
jgi:hypothetical protein